jgi:hypothetical protein
VNPIRFIREVVSAPHYLRSPVAVMGYAYSKWVFSRYRENNPRKFLQSVGIDPAEGLRGFDRWRPEFEDALTRVQQAKAGQGGISLEDGQVLYSLARALRPDFIVETGVAAGMSTSFFGAALIENQHGTLYSIELPPTDCRPSALADGSCYAWHEHGVGWAIPKSIRASLAGHHKLVLRDVRQALPEILEQIPHVDIFFHDDLHTPDHMLWEYQLIWPHIRSGGALISDDANYGWIQFCGETGQGKEAYGNLCRLTAVRKP